MSTGLQRHVADRRQRARLGRILPFVDEFGDVVDVAVDRHELGNRLAVVATAQTADLVHQRYRCVDRYGAYAVVVDLQICASNLDLARVACRYY